MRWSGARAVVVAAFVSGLFVVAVFNGSAQATDSNQVDFWCDEGIKVEPIGTPSFTVPPPPDGFTWTLLVVKSATDNEVFPNPIPGQSYTPSNGHDLSYVILCMEPPSTSTTSTTTSSSTTTDPSTTTTTTDPSTTTTTDPSTTTTTDPSTTLPGETKTTESPPVGGVNAGGGAMAVSGWEAAVLWLAGGAVALLGGTTALAMRRSSGRE